MFSLFSPILFMVYFPLLQTHIYGKENDLVFSLYSLYIFSISTGFGFLFSGYLALEYLITIPKIKNKLILTKNIVCTKEDKYFYKKINRRLNKIYIFLLFITLFFSIFSFPVHLRLNDSGIYYNKIYRFKEKFYSWTELRSVYVHLGKNSLSPAMILEFNGNNLDIWGGAGIGSPNSQQLIKAIDMIHRNTDINVKLDDNFSKNIINELYNNSTNYKRNNILNVIYYLNKKE
jgi:hypothetical protein